MSIETKSKEKRLKKRLQDIQELWHNYKSCNIHIMGTSKGEEGKEQEQCLKQ